MRVFRAGSYARTLVAQWRTEPCVTLILPPSIVRPSVSTGSSRCSTRWCSPTAARPIRPTTSSAPAKTPTASRWRSPASRTTEISIEAHRNVLTVKGERTEESKEDGNEVLYRGIAARAFERRFQLADHVEVTGATLKNGLLHIDLKRNVPEELKPRKIAIANGAGQSQADRSQGGLTADRHSGPERRLRAPLLFRRAAVQTISSPNASTCSAVVAKLVTNRQMSSSSASSPRRSCGACQAKNTAPFFGKPLLLSFCHDARRPRWPAGSHASRIVFDARIWPASRAASELAWRAVSSHSPSSK